MTLIEEAQAKETPTANKTKVKILVRIRPRRAARHPFDSLFVARQPPDFISRACVLYYWYLT